MKLFLHDAFKLGAQRDGQLVDLTPLVAPLACRPDQRLVAAIEHWEELLPEIEARLADTAADVTPLEAAQILPPIPRPENIVCMAVNYMEDGTLDAPPLINAFHKASGSVIGPGGTMCLPDVPGKVFEGEAELALVIGKTARNVDRASAYDHIFGYTCFIDGSVRGLPPDTNTFFQMKSRDTFASIGPCVVTADEIADPQDIAISLTNNGQLMQSFRTSDMAHPIDRCIEWVSSIQTLRPGHILATGTNHRGLNPFMDGDRIELTIEGIGTLAINVEDRLQRVWHRKTRLEHVSEGGKGPYTLQVSGKYAS